MSDDLNRQIFKEEAYDLLGELETGLLELEESPDDMDLVNQVFRALHTIKGSGAMFGFEDIAEFTHEVETVFDMVRNGDLPVTPELSSLTLKARDYIKKMLDGSEEPGVVDPDMMQEILEGLQAVTSSDAIEAAPEIVVLEDATGDSLEVSEEAGEEAGGEQPALSVRHEYQIVLTPKGDAIVEESMLVSLFSELGNLGELHMISHPEEGGGAPLWKLSLISDVIKDNIQDVFFFADADLDFDIFEVGQDVSNKPAGPEEAVKQQAKAPNESLPQSVEDDDFDEETPRLGEILVKTGEVTEEDIQEALKKQKPLGQILAEEGKIAPEKVETAVREQVLGKERDAHKRRQDSLSSIRVAADKLDYLVDLVGELVIVQAQITQVVSERRDPAMIALAEELERLSDELRDSTLGIRMLPIGTSFSKFRRLVRDLSGELGKEIGLSTSGEDTELDKTVIERLGDPMVHLLRNSIGHGIETPDERRAAGKPPQGMIFLSAEHSGGEVLIQIVDDGKGMASKMIREKAIERGLITKETELSEKELLKLIFEPGFSTATEVTNVSGRGVGMDVVKRAIDSLRGSIDIDSKPGKGTTITIRLPLTLAIIDGLQVQVGDGYYVIPLSLVEECVELAGSDVEIIHILC